MKEIMNILRTFEAENCQNFKNIQPGLKKWIAKKNDGND